MISITQQGPEYEIKFPYDPVLVAYVKNVPGRLWHKEDKCWTVPKDKVGFFVKQLEGTSYENCVNVKSSESFNVNKPIAETKQADIPDIDISDVHTVVKSGSKLFDHQLDCLRYSIGRKEKGNFGGFLLADEMGCCAGDSVVHVAVNGKHRNVTLSALCDMYSLKLDSDEYLIKTHYEKAKGAFAYLPIRCVLDKGCKKTVKVAFSDKSFIVCTPDHEFLTDVGWVEAQYLTTGENVVKDYSCELCKYKQVTCVRPYSSSTHVFDVGIDHPTVHNFVCNGVVVHNCGKTLEVINLAMFKKQYEAAKHCLVICCVNSAKYNWAEDIKLHTNGQYEGYILGSRKQKRKGTVRYGGSGKEKLQDLETGYMYSDEKEAKPLPFFLILNIEALRTTDRTQKRRSRDVLSIKIAELCMDGYISMIAVDEIHRNASPQSAQGKELIKIKKLTGDRVEWIPMTGTPVVNKPTDVFLPMYLIGAHQDDSYWRWNQRYCIYGGYGGHNIMGYKNIPELKSILEPNMLRRTKEQVLDLPPKIHNVEYVENSKVQQALYSEVKSEMLENLDEVRQASNPLSKFLRLRQVNGCPELIDDSINPASGSYLTVNAKMKRLVELVQDICSNGEKAVVFSNWVAPLRSAYRCLKKAGFDVASYTGQMDQAEREENKHRFISDPNCQVILGTIGALGTSHTLTVASNVIFLDSSWNMATQEQAEDRCYRATSTKTVNVYEIITRDTVDERVHDIMTKKGTVSDYVVDNRLNLKEHPEMLEYLLS